MLDKAEGRISHQLIETLKIFYEDWGEDEIAKEWAKNVSKVIRKLVQESARGSSKKSDTIKK